LELTLEDGKKNHFGKVNDIFGSENLIIVAHDSGKVNIFKRGMPVQGSINQLGRKPVSKVV